MSSVETCFSNPSGMSDFLETAISSISSRSTTCRLASASISSTEVFVSDESNPLITRPSLVATVYCTKLPSTLRLGSMMWVKSSMRGTAAVPVKSGPTWPPVVP